MSSLDYVTMLPSGPFVQPGFYGASHYPPMPGFETSDLDPLTSQALSSSFSSSITEPTVSAMVTSGSIYPALSAVDREIERQRRRNSPAGRRASHRERSTSTSSYRSSRRSSAAQMGYGAAAGMAVPQQPLPASDSPSFASTFLTVSSSPSSQSYYSTLSDRYDPRSDAPTFEYPPLPSQPLFPMERTLPPSELTLHPSYTGHSGMGGTTRADEGVRVVGSRPKPQCWDHGCNGRQFSTFSNLLRHQREKSGTASKSECPYCGTVFTRTTARNGHMAQGKCKARKDSDS